MIERFNVDMDLGPYERINPCGMQDLAVTQLVELGVAADAQNVRNDLLAQLEGKLGAYFEEADS